MLDREKKAMIYFLTFMIQKLIKKLICLGPFFELIMVLTIMLTIVLVPKQH